MLQGTSQIHPGECITATRNGATGIVRWWTLRLATVCGSVVVAVALVEIALRVTRDESGFFPYHKHSKRIFYPSESATPGISGPSYFTTNSFGTRGSDPGDCKYRLLVIGGSTAACTALNDDETWPHLMERYIDQHYGDERTLWVTNSGIDGLNTRHHIMHAKYLVPNMPELDYVLVYAGLNDVGLWLYSTEFDPYYLDDAENWTRTVAQSFRVSAFASPDVPWYKRLELWKQASAVRAIIRTRRLAKQQRAGVIVQDERFAWMEAAARRRREIGQRLVPRAKMETLGSALKAYGANLRSIIRYCRDGGAEPILVAQYIQWTGLTEEERHRLWMGAVSGGASYIREEQMAELVIRFNQAMKEVADEAGVLFVDLPAALSGRAALCIDGCHFNEEGARLAARELAECLVKAGLFTPQS